MQPRLGQTFYSVSNPFPRKLVPTIGQDMYLEKLTEPAFAVVTLARARQNSNIPPGQDEDLLVTLIAAAQDYIERYLECTIGLAEWRLTIDSFPPTVGQVNWERTLLNTTSTIVRPAQLIPLWPIRAINAISYRDAVASTDTAFDVTKIVQPIGSDRFHLRLKKNTAWPSTDGGPNAVAIRFTAGYANPAAIPATMSRAALMLVAHWYENREAVVMGTTKEIELGVEAMLAILETEYD
jgi:uncharacterized phiE125 gp8 family phage protein